MNKFLKLDPEQKFIANVAGIALCLPLILLAGYAIATIIRTVLN